MHKVKLSARLRETTGKEYCKKMRKKGFVPGVIYGKNFQNVIVSVEEKELRKTLATSAGTRVIVVLNVQDENEFNEYTTMVYKIQKDTFQKRYYHIDFHKISLHEKVSTEIPINLKGVAKGVHAGGMMDQILWRIPMEALPLELPEKIDVDVSHLEENESLTVADLNIPEGSKALVETDELICIVHPPRVMEEVEAEAEAEAEMEEGAEPAEASEEAVPA